MQTIVDVVQEECLNFVSSNYITESDSAPIQTVNIEY